jgi:hypothetical protein
MSLINDALKRAREAQAQAPPPPASNLEFRPVEPAQLVKHGPSLTLIATACLALILGGLLMWQWLGKSNATKPVVAKAAPAVQPAPPPTTTAPMPTPPPVSAPAQAPQPPAIPETKLVASAPAPASEISTSAIPAVQPGAPVPVAVIEPPSKPAPPRLQAIVFRRTRPSAMISGKTLFVGDKFGDFRVVAISEDSATLVGGGQTNVLVLPQ